jgi:hypothetical protein
LLSFALGSIRLAGTRIENFRGPLLLRVINDYYMPFITAGWTVPLAFVLDVSAMLLFGGVAYTTRWKDPHLPPKLSDLSRRYYQMLREMRGNPLFRHVAHLVKGASSDARRNASIQVFLRFLLAELSHIPKVVAFNARDLRVHALRMRTDFIESASLTIAQKRTNDVPLNLDLTRVDLADPSNELLIDLMEFVAKYYSEHRLGEFISPEELFMIEYAARSDRSIERIDYHLLHRILTGPEVAKPETWPPLNTMVEEQIPTESYQQDGRIGGYVDINRKCLSETVSEILPAEFALARFREVLFHKLVNEGVLHYIREDIERIEPELRILFYFVVDSGSLMQKPPGEVHARLATGITPWVLGKSLMVELLRDLARYFPRKNVRADVVWYLWGPDEFGSPVPGYRDKFDLFAWDAERSADRYEVATRLAEAAPAFFYHHLNPSDQNEFVPLDPDPWRNFEVLSQNRMYHCRNLVLFTSPMTRREFMPVTDLGVSGDEYGRDSICVVIPDPSRPTVDMEWPASLTATAYGRGGTLSEERLRSRFLETVLLKAAARRPPSVQPDIGDA